MKQNDKKFKGMGEREGACGRVRVGEWRGKSGQEESDAKEWWTEEENKGGKRVMEAVILIEKK